MRPTETHREQLDALDKVLSRENFTGVADALFSGTKDYLIDASAKKRLIDQCKQLEAEKVSDMILALEQKAASITTRAMMAENRLYGPSKQSSKLRMRVNDINALIRSMAHANEEIREILEQSKQPEILESEAA